MSIADIVSAIPDHIRMLPAIFAGLRILATLLGYTFWEDGSMAP